MTVSELPESHLVNFPLFGTPPLRRVGQQLRVPAWQDRRFGILAVIGLAWVPVVALSAIEGRLLQGRIPAYSDFSLHARILVALPALLLGKLATDHLLSRAVTYLLESGAIPENKRARFEDALRRVARWRDSWPMMLLLIALAYALTATELARPVSYAGSWKVTDERSLSLAGYWYFLVTRPIFFTHLLAWIWTFGLWSSLLVSLVRLPIRLFAFHADGAGGMEPLLSVHRTFVVISFAVGADLAGALANRMVHLNEPYTLYRTLLIVVVVTLTVVLLAPLVLFAYLLVPARYDAIESFGAMTFELSRMLERDSRLGARIGLDESKLALIRSFADSYGGHKVITGTPFVPVTRNYVLSFLAAPCIPLVLAMLTRVPLRTLIAQFQHLTHF